MQYIDASMYYLHKFYVLFGLSLEYFLPEYEYGMRVL